MEERQGDGYFPSIQSKPGYPAVQVVGGSERVNKALIPALLMHFLIVSSDKEHQEQGQEPSPSFLPEEHLHSYSLRCLLVYSSLPSAPTVPGCLNPEAPATPHALCVPTLYDLVVKTLPGSFRFADLLRQMNQSQSGMRISGNKSPKMQFSEMSQTTSKKGKENKCKLFWE